MSAARPRPRLPETPADLGFLDHAAFSLAFTEEAAKAPHTALAVVTKRAMERVRTWKAHQRRYTTGQAAGAPR